MKATLEKWIHDIMDDGEKIESIVFGEFGWGGFKEDDSKRPKIGELLTFSEALPFLQEEFDQGFGAPETYAINVWTDKRVMFVTQYDGSTSMDWVYRNPTAYKPSMPGG